ncbi:hypothetical protein ACIOG8_36510 [Streptomyces erythrochromogenes]|uniref:hypothetical protein n=1 Tax=Streptomyces erythrochromogenes TaxID=285574 RepID=UPI00381E13CC
MSTPAGAVTRWTYDEGGHCTEITASGRTLTFERDAAGRELTRRIGDSTALHHTYDAVGRLTTRHITGSDQRTLLRRGYSYRAGGNLLAIDDEATGPRTFTLDSASRVNAVDAAPGRSATPTTRRATRPRPPGRSSWARRPLANATAGRGSPARAVSATSMTPKAA